MPLVFCLVRKSACSAESGWIRVGLCMYAPSLSKPRARLCLMCECVCCLFSENNAWAIFTLRHLTCFLTREREREQLTLVIRLRLACKYLSLMNLGAAGACLRSQAKFGARLAARMRHEYMHKFC
jgi:hypothetical protein